MGLIAVAIYLATHALASLVGYEAAEFVLFLPAFFAVLLLNPIKHWTDTFYRRRHCAAHGHLVEVIDGPTHHYVCRRCHEYLGSSHLSK